MSLSSIFVSWSFQKDRKIKNEESRVEQSSFKNMMQEELLHKTLGKQANELEAHEKARRIHESTNVTEEDAKRQKTMDMLLGVQRQLLDAMSHAEVQTNSRAFRVLSSVT